MSVFMQRFFPFRFVFMAMSWVVLKEYPHSQYVITMSTKTIRELNFHVEQEHRVKAKLATVLVYASPNEIVCDKIM